MTSEKPRWISGSLLNMLAGVVIVLGLLAAVLMAVTGGNTERVARYDISQFREVDESLITHIEVNRFDPGIAEPTAVAVGPDDFIYVAGDGKINVFDADGRFARNFFDLPSPVTCLAVDSAGRIYIGTRSRLIVLAADGKLQPGWDDMGKRAVLTSITFDDDFIYLADAGNRLVWKYDYEGRPQGTIGERATLLADGTESVGLVVPSAHFDVSMAPDGLLRVVNPGKQRVEAYTADGRREFFWGVASMQIEGFSGCCNPTDIAVLPDGTLATSEKGLQRIKIHDNVNGELLGVVAGPKDFDAGVRSIDLAADSQGRIIALPVAAPNALTKPRPEVRIYRAKDEER